MKAAGRVLGAIFLPGILAALAAPTPAYGADGVSVDLFATGLKLFAGTAVVVGIMLLLHYLNKRGVRFFEGKSGGSIRIVENRAVGGRKSLCLVEVRGETLLLGLGHDRIDMLHHFGGGAGDGGTGREGRFEKELGRYRRKNRPDGGRVDSGLPDSNLTGSNLTGSDLRDISPPENSRIAKGGEQG